MTTITDLATTTIPPDQIRSAGEPVFPQLRGRLFGYHEAMLLDLVNAREAYGVAKYGQTLMSDDGRDTPTEIINEMIDMLAYMTKLQMQSPSHLFEYRLSQAIALSVQVLEVLHDMEAHR